MANERTHEGTPTDLQVLDLIRTSNVLNPDVTLDKVLILTRALINLEIDTGETGGLRPGKDWNCISKYFIINGDFPKRVQ